MEVLRSKVSFGRCAQILIFETIRITRRHGKVSIEFLKRTAAWSGTRPVWTFGSTFPSRENILRQKLSSDRFVAILAESGAGKSALASGFLASAKTAERYIWLKPSQLSRGSQRELGQHLGLRHQIATLIRNSTRAGGILVLDGFGQFEGDALDRALELVRELAGDAAGGWRLVITCQTLRWQDRRRRLLDAGVSSVAEMVFAGPTFEQIRRALKDIGGMTSVLLRPELRDVLLNLATLDQVVKTAMTQPFSTTRSWIGESEVIDWVWAYWSGSDAKRFARAKLLRTLSEKEGTHLSGAVRLEDVSHDRLELLGELCDAIFCASMRIRFSLRTTSWRIGPGTRC